MMLKEELLRYSRQIILPEVGGRGQRRLLNAHVLIIGAGGLGCPTAPALASAGVGSLTLVDDDRVELSNLPRQLAFTDADIGALKVVALGEFLSARSGVKVTLDAARVEPATLPGMLESVDLVIDASDNFPTRFAIASAARSVGRSRISGAVTGFAAQLFCQNSEEGPCIACLLEAPPDDALSCLDAGVLPGATMAIGGLMAQAALGALLHDPELPWGQLITLELRRFTQRNLRVTQREGCEVCS